MAHLTLSSISKSFEANKGSNFILRDINLDVDLEETVAIVGYSGSGKTTLLSVIAGLTLPSSGSIFLNNKPIQPNALGRGLIFQHYALLPWLTVFENVKIGIDATFPQLSRNERSEIAINSLEKVNLLAALNKKPSELSGGMKQRVAVARTLAVDPEMFLMDEPLSALDAITRSKIQVEILKIIKESKKAAILITNSVEEAIIMSDRVIPILPTPASTLGHSFKVSFPKDTTSTKNLTLSDDFRNLKNEITTYLLKNKKH